MGATVGPNIALTDFIARSIVRKVADEASVGNDCKNTEELLSKFEEYNCESKNFKVPATGTDTALF